MELGQVLLIAEAGGDPAGEPVMAVDEAVANPAASRLGENGLPEFWKQIEEARLVDVFRRPYGQARHPAPPREPDPVRPLLTRPPGDNLGRDAAPAQLLADRPHRDVPPALFARPAG